MNLTDIIKSIVWYNGLIDAVTNWIKQPITNDFIVCPKNYGLKEVETIDEIEAKSQLQLLWMIAVLIFGDYGSSPRYGWITDIAGFQSWCRDIIKTIKHWDRRQNNAI